RVAVLRNYSENPVRMPRRDAITDRGAEIENVEEEPIHAERLQKTFGDVGEMVERIVEASTAPARRGGAAVPESRIVRREQVDLVRQPIDQARVLMRSRWEPGQQHQRRGI